jgi:hypothetical protein
MERNQSAAMMKNTSFRKLQLKWKWMEWVIVCFCGFLFVFRSGVVTNIQCRHGHSRVSIGPTLNLVTETLL